MTTTGSIVAMLLIVTLVASAHAQTQPPTPTGPPGITRPLDRSDLRHQIYVMEGALMRAVSFGAQRLNREIRSVVPEMMTLSGEPQARGVYLDGYGVYFDVGVPILHQSMVWSLRNMLGQDDKGLVDALNVIKQQAKEARTPASRTALENAAARLEVGLGPFNSANKLPELQFPTSGNKSGDQAVGAAAIPSEAPPTAGTAPSPTPPPVTQAPQQIDLKYLQDPNAINRAYTTSVQNALVDAMIEYSLPMALGPDEFLTVGARDNMPRDSFAPRDPYEEIVTIVLRIKGSDLAAYRAGHLDRAEARKRVQIREF